MRNLPAVAWAWVAMLLLASLSAQAQIKPGEYVSTGGLGVLRITADKSGALRFQLNSRGGNFHLCNLDGVIRNGEARMDDSADEKLPCVVTFKTQKDGIVVDSKHGRACSSYCGARAHFEAAYLTPPAGCAPSQVNQTRNRFKATYDKKLFAEARDMLAPIVEKCAATISELDDGWLRNDLALTQHRAGDSTACRNTLKPWLELAQKPDETIQESYPPSDAAEILRVVKATRANLRLCGAPVTIGVKGK
jgi:hypothetical protein